MAAMEDEASWPLRQVLRLVRPDGGMFPQPGLLVAGCGPVVHLVAAREATPRALRFCEKLAYPDFEAVRRDGWVAD